MFNNEVCEIFVMANVTGIGKFRPLNTVKQMECRTRVTQESKLGNYQTDCGVGIFNV